MSDGGTFCFRFRTGGRLALPHLAPVSASFHPMLASMADRNASQACRSRSRMARDWMFREHGARGRNARHKVGANVTYREIADLAHARARSARYSGLDEEAEERAGNDAR